VPVYRKIKAMSSKSVNSKENPTSLNPTASPPKSAVPPSPSFSHYKTDSAYFFKQ